MLGEGQQSLTKRAPSPPVKGAIGECCKLAQWGPGRSDVRMWFWCISGLEKSTNRDISHALGWLFSFSAFGVVRKISFHNRWGSVDPPAPLK